MRLNRAVISSLVLLLFADGFAAVPDLSPTHRIELETARDGEDYTEQAFVALVEHVRQWDGAVWEGAADAVVIDAEVTASLLTAPDEFRGQLISIEGRLEQATWVNPAYGTAREWFVRLEDGRPIIVYAVGDRHGSEQIGASVSILTRFYKPIELIARDGRTRRYPALVGTHPRFATGDTATAPGNIWQPIVMVLLVSGFAIAWWLLRRMRPVCAPARRNQPTTSVDGPSRDDRPADDLGEADSLPSDPAEALAEMRRRADATRP